MWGLGQSPILFPQVAGFFPAPTTLFGPAELETMARFLTDTDAAAQERMAVGMAEMVTRLKREDSVNSKMALYASGKLKGLLSDRAAAFDEEYPDKAPHTVLLGPRFPLDAREIPIIAKIAAIGAFGVTDDRGFISDPFWSSVPPSDRLTGRTFHVLSGTRAGDDIQIIDHRLKGSGAPSIVLEDTTDLSPGDKFKILDIVIPNDHLGKWDRAVDWVISTPILDTFDGANTSPVIRSSYWTAKTNLKGRDLIVAGTTYKITTHTLLTSIAIEGSPSLGLASFAIPAMSPFRTGVQPHGTLRANDGTTFGNLEPGTKIRLSPRSLGGVSGHAEIKAAQRMLDRYLNLRFQKYFGSAERLRRFRKTAKLINEQQEQALLRREDILLVRDELNLPLDASE